MYHVFALLTNYRIVTDQHTTKGRTDITLDTADHIFVMKLKFDKTGGGGARPHQRQPLCRYFRHEWQDDSESGSQLHYEGGKEYHEMGEGTNN